MAIRVMRVADVLKLPSVDSRGNLGGGKQWTWGMSQDDARYMKDPTDRRATTGETLLAKGVQGQYYDDIREDTLKHGINSVPVHVGPGRQLKNDYGVSLPDTWDNVTVMGNGHHRLRILHDLGLQNVIVTDSKSESGWNNEHSNSHVTRLLKVTRREQ